MARFLFRCIKFAHTFLTKIGKRDTANMMVNGHFFKGLNHFLKERSKFEKL